MGPRGVEGNWLHHQCRTDEKEVINLLLHFVGATKLVSFGSFLRREHDDVTHVFEEQQQKN